MAISPRVRLVLVTAVIAAPIVFSVWWFGLFAFAFGPAVGCTNQLSCGSGTIHCATCRSVLVAVWAWNAVQATALIAILVESYRRERRVVWWLGWYLAASACLGIILLWFASSRYI